MPQLPSSDSQLSEKSSSLPPNAFDSQTAKAGIKKFAALWPLMPPIALFGIAFSFIGSPLPTPLGNHTETAVTSVASAGDWVVPASETMIVARQAASGYALLRGRLRAAQGEVISAPSRGQVARVMARVGQVVKAGTPLLLISRGTIDAPRSTSPLERWQTQAEDAQIAAAKQQESLESRMSGANERLKNAQERVAEAQARVADARALIKKLQNGEDVNRSEMSTPAKATPTPSPRQPNNSGRNEKARAEALKASQQLQKVAEAAEAKAKAANAEAKEADGEVREKQSQLKAASAALASAKATVIKSAPAKPPADGEAGNAVSAPATPRPSTPDTAAETKAVSAARDALATATSRAAGLHREASKLQARATESRGNSNDAARRAMESLQVFEAESAPESPSKIVRNETPRETPKSGGGIVTIDDAVRIARQAMKESDEAIADADRIRREVKGYARPVSGTKRRVDDATRRLQNAQQQIWNTAGVSRPNLTTVGASTEGIVLWMAGMTSEVRGGEIVASIGRPDRLEVNVQDFSGAWKSLTPGARVLALVKNDAPNGLPATSATDSTGRSTPPLARSTSTAPTASSATMKGVPTLARVMAIAPPVKPGAPATIRIAIHNPPKNAKTNDGSSPRTFLPGMGVLFSLARPGKQVMIRLPTASIRRGDKGKTFVAVLSPLTDAAMDQPASACRVEWREVRVGAGDGFNNQILTGLEPGERVALRPDALYDFTLTYGSQATVRVEQT